MTEVKFTFYFRQDLPNDLAESFQKGHQVFGTSHKKVFGTARIIGE